MRYGSVPRLKRDLITLAIISVAYLGASAFVTNSYYQLIMTLVPIWAIFGVSWNILSGYGGQLSFGHASFFGIGAYVVTLALVLPPQLQNAAIFVVFLLIVLLRPQGLFGRSAERA